MALILATGSNLGDREKYLLKAETELSKFFCLEEKSHLYQSKAVDYLNQPDFLNQVLQFSLPRISPLEVLKIIQEIELNLGRNRIIDKGPRTIDIDILFYEHSKVDLEELVIPHPSISERSFVVRPLLELSFGKLLDQKSPFPTQFDVDAEKLDK